MNLLGKAACLLCVLWLAVASAPIALCMAEPSSGSSMADYTARLGSLRKLIVACQSDASQCRSNKVGADQRIEPEGFEARFGWLREVIEQSSNRQMNSREAVLTSALARIDQEITEANTNAAAGDFDKARSAADKILAKAEFQTVHQSTWWERLQLKFWRWVGQLFGGVSDVAVRNPWLRDVILWGLLFVAIVGLCAWAMRALQRQRLAVRMDTAHGEKLPISIYTQDWAAMAREQARAGDWREAIHCTYWAAIVMMEDRGSWRRGTVRTPREYVWLLPSGSAQQGALRHLTALFERVWYGGRPAAEADFNGAARLVETLKDA